MFKTKVTTDLIEQYLDKLGWPRHQSFDEPGEERGVVVTGWAGPAMPDGRIMMIDPIAEKGALVFKVAKVVQAPPDETPADRMNELLMKLAVANYELLMGAFGLDPRDGEVVFKLTVPVVTDTFTFEDFELCMRMSTAAVEFYHREFEGILAG